MAAVAKEEGVIELPPGFRFHPTDEEIITYYLSPKLVSHGFSARAIGEVDLNKCEPWDLPSKAKMEGKEMYFFCHRDRKYPTGMRTNRATESGYWKATGKDKEIFRGKGTLVGMKKTLVFYKGRAPRGEKTNWVMHEFRLEGKLALPDLPKSVKDEWVVCRVFHKNMGAAVKKSPPPPPPPDAGELLFEPVNSFLPPLMDPPQLEQHIINPDHCFYDFSSTTVTNMSMENQQQAMMLLLANSSSSNSNSLLCYPPSSQVAPPPPHQQNSYGNLLGAYSCKVEQCPPSPANADQNTQISLIDEPWTSYGFGV